ncbi:hypothetical protein [Paenibacillus sp. HJGM_3]|uniref:hypothetical protein n=1 Tax=Paenibacillus sp. HJGM_3 TaxID=3379816 RepID=UPI00385C0A5B
MTKSDVYRNELAKLEEIFREVDPAQAKLVEGLIKDAAFLAADNHVLREAIDKTGTVQIHPTNPNLQRTTEAAKQYLKNLNSYAVVIKTLNGVLSKNGFEGEDDFEEFMRESRKGS